MKTTTYTLLTALLLLAWGCGGKGDKTEDQAEKTATVKVLTVSEQDVDQNRTYTATVEPEIINNISAAMANRIKAIYVDEGMRVSAGQKLAVLDDVNTIAYEAQVDNAKANLKDVQQNYDRAKQLLAIGGGTQQQVDAMEIQLVNARNALTTAQRTLRNARENTVLTSPINGVVTARNYDPGDMTGQLPILTVARVEPVKLVINVPESEFADIHKGMAADIKFDTYGDEQFNGTVTLIAPTVDQASRTFGVEVTLPNKTGKVLPGMFGRVTLNLGNKNRVVVPDRAVVKQRGSGTVFVYSVKDGKVVFNKVELGQRLDTNYEIISGLEPGAQVIVSDQSKLTNGEKVNIAK